MNEVTSKGLRNATELMLRIPVRAEFVQGGSRLTSVATRLKTLLNALFELRKVAAERDRLLPAGPIDSLESIYSTMWGVVERPAASELMVATAFDGNWEDYFQLLVDHTGELLDAIFCHCEGYAGHGCLEAGFDPFVQWIRQYQVECDFFYTPIPDLTTSDLRHARNLLQERGPAQLPVDDLRDAAKRAATERAAELARQRGVSLQQLERERHQRIAGAVGQFYKLRSLFPDSEMLGGLKTQAIFDRAIHKLLGAKVDQNVRDLLGPGEQTWVKSWKPVQTTKPKQEAVARAAIQGNILEPYNPPAKRGCIAFVQCDDAKAARKLLGDVCPDVTHAGDDSKSHKPLRVNVALTYAGLERLKLDQDTLALLPKELKEGMAARAGAMGDVGYPNHPGYWELPEANWPAPGSGERVELSTVDVVLMLQDKGAGADEASSDATTRDPFEAWLADLESKQDGARILHVHPLERSGPRGHFGMLEGGKFSSQPVPDAKLGTTDLTEGEPERNVVALGELLLGYPNQRNRVAECAKHDPERFENGSFLVLRKMEQHVEAFEQYRAQRAGEAGVSPERLTGWLLGRDANGEPLTADANGPNDFDYQNDPGTQCPFHAHIRRANPRRHAMEPRIMRRGFGYREAGSNGDDPARGLMFMAYNASISRQYEVVQRWLNGGNSTGLPSTQNDLLTGAPQPSATHWVIDGGAWKAVAAPSKPLTSLRWGLYLFVPSMRAIEKMSEEPDEDEPRFDPRLASEGDRIMAHIDALPDCMRARHAWKQVIEEDPQRAAAVWEAIRASGKPKWADGYALLVADRHLAEQVLANRGDRYSVCEYQRRLNQTIGMHYLALDPEPRLAGRPHVQGWDCSYEPLAETLDYGQQSSEANAYILGLDEGKLYGVARQIATAFMIQQGAGVPVDLRSLVSVSVAKLAQGILGIPATSDEDLIAALQDFILVSRYSFYPHPEPWLKHAALNAGAALRERYGAPKNGGHGSAVPGPMASYLRNRPGMDEESIRVAVMGAIVGFAAPAVASTLGVLRGWLESGELWRLRMHRLSLERDGAPDETRWKHELAGAISTTLRHSPMPPILYRTVLPGAAASPESRRQPVVLGLSAIAEEARQRGEDATPWLFGGKRQPGANGKGAVHGCPARDPALSMMRGIVDTLLRCRNIRQRATLTVEVGEVPPPYHAGSPAPKAPVVRVSASGHRVEPAE